METTALIVGASVAGARVARDLHRHGYAGSIVLVDAQNELPYDRPPLSKSMLTGADDAPTPLLSAEDAATLGIALRLGVGARSLELASSTVQLRDGTALHYDDLVIATGADARPTPWPPHPRILELRTLAQGRALRQALRSNRSVLIVGAGFIGAEVASAAWSLGLDVTMVDPLAIPMGRLFGDKVGSTLSGLHARHGVSTRFGLGVASIEPAEQIVVTLTDGSVVCVDLVVVGIGVLPNTGWLEGSGLVLDNGVVCDSQSRAIGQQHVYAAGDVACWLHPRHGEQVRVEHWTNALEQAQYVAKAITSPGDLGDYAPVEYVWSDQYDWKIQVAGSPPRGLDHVIIIESDSKTICALWSNSAGILVGALTVNWPKAAVLSRRAIANGTSATSIEATLQK